MKFSRIIVAAPLVAVSVFFAALPTFAAHPPTFQLGPQSIDECNQDLDQGIADAKSCGAQGEVDKLTAAKGSLSNFFTFCNIFKILPSGFNNKDGDRYPYDKANSSDLLSSGGTSLNAYATLQQIQSSDEILAGWKKVAGLFQNYYHFIWSQDGDTPLESKYGMYGDATKLPKYQIVNQTHKLSPDEACQFAYGISADCKKAVDPCLSAWDLCESPLVTNPAPGGSSMSAGAYKQVEELIANSCGNSKYTDVVSKLTQCAKIPAKPTASDCMKINDLFFNSIAKQVNSDGTPVAPAKPAEQPKVNPPINAFPNPLRADITNPQVFIGNFIKVLLGIVGSLAFALVVVGGVQWMTSAGNAEKVASGKKTVMWALLGLVAIFLSYGAVNFLLGFG